MLKRYGDEAMAESAKANRKSFAADGDALGPAIWHRVIDAIGQLRKDNTSGASALIGARGPRR
jgi:hypothetical protein